MPRTGATVFGLLGELVVAVDGEPRAVPGDKVRLLLAMLAVDPGRVVGTDALLEELWGTPGAAQDAGRLHAVVTRARRALAGGSAIEFRSGGYVLASGASTDVQRSAELCRLGAEASSAGEFEVAADRLRAALALYRGAAYVEFADREFFRAEAARADEARLQLTERLGSVLLAADRHADAVAVLEPHVGAHPLREEAAAHLMTALHRCGRRADALTAYRTARERLVEELGLDPGPELRRAEALVLSIEPVDRREHVARSNLPNLGGRFVGRAAELAELGELLSSQRLVTIWGPGGAGKTRLAVEAAGRFFDGFADGLWFAPLASVELPEQVAPAIMSALGMLGAPDGDPIAALADNLKARQMLLVLDNCEHVLDGAARVAHALLTTCPRVQLIATSREPLLVPDEYVWPARSLALPAPDADLATIQTCDAGALFLDRIRLAAPGSGEAEGAALLVAEICRRLDGIPLALELAAARVRALCLQGVADRLDDQFALLTGGHRTADSRHRTMRAAIEWGVALASAAERDLLSCLAVFPGTFDVDAAHAVAGGTEIGATADVLAQLVDRSLLMVADDGPGRYRLLEPIRQYAREQAPYRTRADELRQRFVDHCVARVANSWSLWFEGSAEWPQWRVDGHNFRAAIEWALADRQSVAAVRLGSALVAYWASQDDPEDRAAHWLERALALADPPGSLEAAVTQAAVAWFRGDLALARCAVEKVARTGDGLALATAKWAAANVLARSDPEQGRARLTERLENATAHGYQGVARSCLLSLAYVELALGNAAAAREHSERLIADISQRRAMAPMDWGCHALVLGLNGEHESAEFAAQQALLSAGDLGLAGLRALALLRAATVSTLAGKRALALQRLVDLVILLRRLSTRRWLGDTLHLAAIVLADLDRLGGVPHLLEAAERYGAHNETPGGTLPFVSAAVQRAREIASATACAAAPVDLADRDGILRLALDELRAAAGSAR